jgi:CubicO group peptidase (beta-lactamase class C family)
MPTNHSRQICSLVVLLFIPFALSAQGRRTGSEDTALAKQSAAVPAEFSDFDTYIPRLMKEWGVPGAAVVIVKDGKVVSSKGYGLRDVKNNLPVTEQTLFPIASITKSFTASALAVLVAEDRLGWDKPVRNYLPDFRLYDDLLTAHVTARDLLTHRTGIPANDKFWFNSGLSIDEIYARVRYLEPNHELRSEFQYNNVMYMIAGYLAGKVAGGSWEDAVQTRIFDPLGMKSSNFDMGKSFKSLPDVAHPYRKMDDEVPFEIPPYTENKTLGAAGAIVSNLSDMTQYLLMYINGGKHGDQQIIPERQIRNNILFPEMPIQGGNYPEFGDQIYGLGVNLTTYRGHKEVDHSGGLKGFSLLLSFLPDDKSGSVILLNMEDSRMAEVLAYSIDDRLLGLAPVDWDKRFRDRYLADKEENKKEREKVRAKRREDARFGHPIDSYVGKYENPAYGLFLIERGAGSDDLKITFHRQQAIAEHWEYEVWTVPHDAPEPALRERSIMFHADWNGNISNLTCPLEPASKDIVFTRVLEKSSSTH